MIDCISTRNFWKSSRAKVEGESNHLHDFYEKQMSLKSLKLQKG